MTIKDVLNKLKNPLKRIRGFFPTSLPQGLAEYNEWIVDFIDTYNPPMEERSVKFVIATLMMRLNPTEAYKPKRYFALCLHKGAAAEVSNFVMRQIKDDQEKEIAAQQEAAKQAEATANLTPTAAATDEQQISN